VGLEVRRHPLFAIEPVSWTLPDGPFDGLLLTSANAVRNAGTLPPLPVHAVGEATAAAARFAGLDVVSVGEGGAKDLIAGLDPEHRLLHLAGEEHVLPRGAHGIVTVPVYRAVPLGLPDAGLVEGSVLLVHSPAAGRRIGLFKGRRVEARIAAISAAAAEACGEGWERVGAAAVPNDSALLSLAAELCKD
jgi:uroporphyrinogen-III synthase